MIAYSMFLLGFLALVHGATVPPAQPQPTAVPAVQNLTNLENKTTADTQQQQPLPASPIQQRTTDTHQHHGAHFNATQPGQQQPQTVHGANHGPIGRRRRQCADEAPASSDEGGCGGGDDTACSDAASSSDDGGCADEASASSDADAGCGCGGRRRRRRAARKQ